MFIQVIQAKSSRHDEVRALMQEWGELTDDGISGFLGGTTDSPTTATFISVVRFESKEKAMANSTDPRRTPWRSGWPS